jgi:hypothetical protein
MIPQRPSTLEIKVKIASFASKRNWFPAANMKEIHVCNSSKTRSVCDAPLTSISCPYRPEYLAKICPLCKDALIEELFSEPKAEAEWED